MRTQSSDKWDQSKLPGSWDVLNFDLLYGSTNRFGIPDLRAEILDTRPLDAAVYGQGNAEVRKHSFCHFFLDDYRFERVFQRRRQCLPTVQSYAAVFTPDFSLWTDMPLVMQLWNVYRSRWCGAFWQANGAQIGVTAQWADEPSWEFCFLGIPMGMTMAVSVPSLKDENVGARFRSGLQEMFRQCNPAGLVLFCKPTDDPDDLVPKELRRGLEFVDVRLQRAYQIRIP